MTATQDLNVVTLRPSANNSLGLRFETQDDALRYAQEIVEVCVGLQRAANRFGIDHYLNADSDLVIRLKGADGYSNFTVSIRIVEGLQRSQRPPSWEPELVDLLSKKKHAPMFRSASQSRKRPDQFSFPMLVRFNRSHEIKQGRVDASAFSLDLTFERDRAIGDREVNVFGVRASELNGGVAHCIVNCASEFGRDIGGQTPFRERDSGAESEVYNILTRIRVSALDDVFALCVLEDLQAGLQVVNICFGGTDTMQGAFERAEIVDETDF